MLDESINLPDDQIYLELITTVLNSETQIDDGNAEELISLLKKLLETNDDLDPGMFIAGWLRYAV